MQNKKMLQLKPSTLKTLSASEVEAAKGGGAPGSCCQR